MTTRKVATAGVACGLLAGCATPGPLHVYSLSASAPETVHDEGDGRTVAVSSFVTPGETLAGFAYDPFTDHFFLRLAPGNRIRVVDRPARAVKREYTIDAPAAQGPGDLAVRPRDGHLFLLLPGATTVLETTRLGKTVGTLALARVASPPIGIALDPVRDRLLVLHADGRQISVHDLHGGRTATLTLERSVAPSLAVDAEKRELYAPLRERADAIGVFDDAGKLLRTVRGSGAFIDVGPRSFLRVF